MNILLSDKEYPPAVSIYFRVSIFTYWLKYIILDSLIFKVNPLKLHYFNVSYHKKIPYFVCIIFHITYIPKILNIIFCIQY